MSGWCRCQVFIKRLEWSFVLQLCLFVDHIKEVGEVTFILLLFFKAV